MGYHIFMARKIQLTSAKNNAYASMMNQWIEQEHLADEEISLMTDKNAALTSRSNKYRTDREAANQAYDNFRDAHRAYVDYKNATDDETKADILERYQNGDTSKTLDADVDPEEAFKDKFGVDYNRYMNNLSDDYQEDKEKVENDYSVDYQILSDQETRIEQAIQVLETHISEYTEEMSKVEQQEATEIKVCIPNYNGAGGGQG